MHLAGRQVTLLSHEAPRERGAVLKPLYVPSPTSRPQQQTVPSSSARSNQNVAQGEGNKPPVVHPRSSQYRWMKSEWRANVYLARSRVQVIWP